jgi:hypothetical protein
MKVWIAAKDDGMQMRLKEQQMLIYAKKKFNTRHET